MLKKTIHSLLSTIRNEIDNGSYDNGDDRTQYVIIGTSMDSVTVEVIRHKKTIGKIKLSLECA